MPPHAVDIAAPADRVRRLAEEALGAQTDPDDPAVLVVAVRFPTGDPTPVRLRIEPRGEGAAHVALETEPTPRVPYFSWFVGPILRSAGRRARTWVERALLAAEAGRPLPPPPKRPSLAPPTNFSPQQAVLLATVCALTAGATYGSSLLSQNVDYVGRAFGASDRALGTALAISRAGVLIALVASALADRRGRRILILVSFAGVCVANGVAAAAPNLAVFTIGQTLMRGFANTALIVAGIAAIEEAPDRARAYSLALLGLAGGFGYAFGVVLLPLSDLAREAWRISFALSAATALLLPSFARNLVETRRYAGLAARDAKRGRVGEVFDPAYGGRFGVLVLTSFLFSIFTAPSAQFTNRYLADSRGFSGLDITIFRGITQGFPGLAGVAIGGRLAETRGRRPVATAALFFGTVAQMVFFLRGSATLWVASSVAIVLGGIAAPALGAFNGEMFPTEIRGTANAFLLVAGVAGSAVGLVVAGNFSDRIGLGPALALTGVASLAASLFVLRLPETAARSLDDVSPSEV
ncbi:MAG TPA: MFS transporter [Acidimicrobiia bacterium]|nr:MFS transporter [Acidimicrobiia bacterium]